MLYKIFDAPEVKMAGDGNGFLTGYASVFTNFDSVKERVVKGAFAAGLNDFMRDGFIAVGHDWSALPIATPMEATEDEFGLKVTGEFHSTKEAQDARTVIRERIDRGKSVKLSIGYEVQSDEYTEEGRLLKAVKLFEWSYVTVPANSLATVTDAKGQPRAGLSFEAHADVVLTTAQAFCERMESMRDTRLKEGRVLSDTNRKRIASLKTSLAEVLKDLDELLAATEPTNGKARPEVIAALLAQYDRLQAHMRTT